MPTQSFHCPLGSTSVRSVRRCKECLNPVETEIMWEPSMTFLMTMTMAKNCQYLPTQVHARESCEHVYIYHHLSTTLCNNKPLSKPICDSCGFWWFLNIWISVDICCICDDLLRQGSAKWLSSFKFSPGCFGLTASAPCRFPFWVPSLWWLPPWKTELWQVVLIQAIFMIYIYLKKYAHVYLFLS